MDTTLDSQPTWRAVLGPLISSRTYRGLTHHLLGLPLGIAYFTWLVTGLSVGAGLAITVIGIPILTAVFATVRPLLAAERGMANALLDADIPNAPLTPGGTGFLGRLAAYWKDGATWRGIAYLLARFPVGLLTFTVAVAAFGAGLHLLAAPIIAPIDTIELGIYEPDTVLEGLALVPLGAALLMAAGWISVGMAAMSRGFARWGAR